MFQNQPYSQPSSLANIARNITNSTNRSTSTALRGTSLYSSTTASSSATTVTAYFQQNKPYASPSTSSSSSGGYSAMSVAPNRNTTTAVPSPKRPQSLSLKEVPSVPYSSSFPPSSVPTPTSSISSPALQHSRSLAQGQYIYNAPAPALACATAVASAHGNILMQSMRRTPSATAIVTPIAAPPSAASLASVGASHASSVSNTGACASSADGYLSTLTSPVRYASAPTLPQLPENEKFSGTPDLPECSEISGNSFFPENNEANNPRVLGRRACSGLSRQRSASPASSSASSASLCASPLTPAAPTTPHKTAATTNASAVAAGEGEGEEEDATPCAAFRAPTVFLGGSCNPTTWRAQIALPMLSAAGISYFNPQIDNWTTEFVVLENLAKEGALILLFVIDGLTRSIASMLEVTELVLRGRRVVLCVEDIPAHTLIDGEEVKGRQLTDLNRARFFLKDLAKRHPQSCLLVEDIPSAITAVIDWYRRLDAEAEVEAAAVAEVAEVEATAAAAEAGGDALTRFTRRQTTTQRQYTVAQRRFETPQRGHCAHRPHDTPRGGETLWSAVLGGGELASIGVEGACAREAVEPSGTATPGTGRPNALRRQESGRCVAQGRYDARSASDAGSTPGCGGGGGGLHNSLYQATAIGATGPAEDTAPLSPLSPWDSLHLSHSAAHTHAHPQAPVPLPLPLPAHARSLSNAYPHGSDGDSRHHSRTSSVSHGTPTLLARTVSVSTSASTTAASASASLLPSVSASLLAPPVTPQRRPTTHALTHQGAPSPYLSSMSPPHARTQTHSRSPSFAARSLAPTHSRTHSCGNALALTVTEPAALGIAAGAGTCLFADSLSSAVLDASIGAPAQPPTTTTAVTATPRVPASPAPGPSMQAASFTVGDQWLEVVSPASQRMLHRQLQDVLSRNSTQRCQAKHVSDDKQGAQAVFE